MQKPDFKQLTRSLVTATLAVILLPATQATAMPIGAAAPEAGYETNSGIERFVADGLVFAVELKDSPGGAFGSFGIYYDTDNLITLFGADDIGAGQSAMVDLTGGSVMDIDQSSYEFFDPRAGSFGFFFAAEDHVTYSEVSLNADSLLPTSIGTYAATDVPNSFLITFEWSGDGLDEVLAMEFVGNIRPADDGQATGTRSHPGSAVPEPSAALLFGVGALFVRRAVHRGKK